MIAELDEVIRQSLTEFGDEVFRRGWYGLEREAVSLYTFGFLVPQCQPGRTLHDPTQIGIEVRVRQLDEPGRKRRVTKDLVIWPAPWMNVWDAEKEPTQYPVAILEWKVNERQVSGYDVDWLSKFSRDLDAFVGYAVCLDLRQRNFRLSCTRVHRGEAQPEWLLLGLDG
jgi:hypothetical protein